MLQTFTRFVHCVAREMGPGHSEAIYQKSLSLLLQDKGIRHQCEYHVPVSFSVGHKTFNVGDERIDILLYDEQNNIHVVELKAVTASVCPRTAVTDATVASGAHLQIMKYLRLLQRSDLSDVVVSGIVVNFKQSVKFKDLSAMDVEMDHYDVKSGKWTFGIGS
jgi:GxxExxY protein